MTAASAIQVCVLGVIRMTLRALELLRVATCIRVPSQRVLAPGHGFEMFGVHARSLATEVIERQIQGDQTDEQFVSEAVS